MKAWGHLESVRKESIVLILIVFLIVPHNISGVLTEFLIKMSVTNLNVA